MGKHRGKNGYQSLNILKEVLFFSISLMVYFPLHIKIIVSCFIFSKYYKAQKVHSLLEKEDFSSACIIDLDNIYLLNMRGEITIALQFRKIICHILGIKVRIHHLWVIIFYLINIPLLSNLEPR